MEIKKRVYFEEKVYVDSKPNLISRFFSDKQKFVDLRKILNAVYVNLSLSLYVGLEPIQTFLVNLLDVCHRIWC